MMSSQLVHLFPGPRVEGVNSIWYGKGPGVDQQYPGVKRAPGKKHGVYNARHERALEGDACVPGVRR
jgi:hypothetical protein